MPMIEIEGVEYFAYADLEEADRFMAAAVGEQADAWRGAEPLAKSRALVSGTRRIDSFKWKGEKTDPDQPGAFPRKDLKNPDGSDVDPDTIPPQVVEASIILAAMLNAGEDINPVSARAAIARRLKAGSVEIENFRQFGVVAPLPSDVMSLLGFWLLGMGSQLVGSESSGTCAKSSFLKPQYKPLRPF